MRGEGAPGPDHRLYREIGWLEWLWWREESGDHTGCHSERNQSRISGDGGREKKGEKEITAEARRKRLGKAGTSVTSWLTCSAEAKKAGDTARRTRSSRRQSTRTVGTAENGRAIVSHWYAAHS